VRKNASRKTLKDTDSLYQFLKDELAGLLIEDNQLKSDTVVLLRSPQTLSCSTAAARKVSPAASITDFP
jgi:hypothetical protein